MRHLLLALLLSPILAHGQVVGLAIPNGNSSSYNSDEVRTASGTHCKQASGSDLTLELGVVGSDAEADDMTNDFRDFTTGSQGSAVYGRVVYQIGAPKRLKCSRVLDLEVERLKAELQVLKEQLMYQMD